MHFKGNKLQEIWDVGACTNKQHLEIIIYKVTE